MPNAKRQIFWLTDPELPKRVLTRTAKQSFRLAWLWTGIAVIAGLSVVADAAFDDWFDYLRLALLVLYPTMAVTYWISYRNLKRLEARTPVDAD